MLTQVRPEIFPETPLGEFSPDEIHRFVMSDSFSLGLLNPDSDVGSGEVRYGEVWDKFAGSPWGIHQARQPLRYSLYSYERTQKQIDHGDSIDPVLHMPLTQEQTRGMVVGILNSDPGFLLGDDYARVRTDVDHAEHADLPPATISDVGRLNIATLLHDAGEGTHPDFIDLFGAVVGDKPTGTKTPEDRLIEGKILRVHLDRFIPMVHPDTRDGLAMLITHQEKSRVHTIAEDAHNWGFYVDGVRAGLLAIEAGEQETKSAEEFNRRDQLVLMTRSILNLAYPVLLDSADRNLHLRERLLSLQDFHADISKL